MKIPENAFDIGTVVGIAQRTGERQLRWKRELTALACWLVPSIVLGLLAIVVLNAGGMPSEVGGGLSDTKTGFIIERGPKKTNRDAPVPLTAVMQPEKPKKAAVEPKSQATPPIQPEATNVKPLEPALSEPQPEPQLSIARQQQPAPSFQPVAAPTIQANDNAQPAAGSEDTVPIAMASSVQIVAGKTAPHFAFDSMLAIQQADREYGVRFLITDGSLSLEIGRDLGDLSKLRTIGSDWHVLYATRMQRIETAQAKAAISAAARQYNQLDLRAARVYLSIPHQLDRLIYKEQLKKMGDTFDVNATTIIQVAFGQCTILDIR